MGMGMVDIKAEEREKVEESMEEEKEREKEKEKDHTVLQYSTEIVICGLRNCSQE